MLTGKNNITEIRWHARGGQGAVTASKTLVEMVLPKDMYFQSFPEYGPERMGAPVQIFNRLSNSPISTYCSITAPDIVVVVDATLMDVVDFTSGLKTGGILIINTHLEPTDIKKSYKLHDYRIYTVDATHIALETIKRPFSNIPMLGALLKVTGLLEKKEAADFLQTSFSKKFPAKIVEKNVEAISRAFDEVKEEVKQNEKVGH